MKPLLILAVLAFGAPALAQADAPQASSLAETSIQLANGIRVTFVPVPDLTRQTTITFLPLSHHGDGAGQPMTAHLLERMMRRCTDAEQDTVDGIQMGGYTKTTHAALYTVAPGGRWEVALIRHARWLRPETWASGVLQREIQKLKDESRAAGSKFQDAHGYAFAAWSQVLRFGLEELDVSASLERLDEEGLRREIQARVPIGPGIEIYCMGPVSQEWQETILQREFGQLPVGQAADEPTLAALPEEDELSCVWDLPWRHLMLWWPVTPKEPWHRVAATLLADRLNFRFGQHEEDELSDGKAHAALTELRPDEPIVVVSVALPEGTRARNARRLLDRELKELPKSRGLAFRDQIAGLVRDPEEDSSIGATIARWKGFMSPERFEAMEARNGYMEWNLLTGRLDARRKYGGSSQEIGAIAAAIDVNKLEKYPKKVFHNNLRHELLLGPAEEE